MTDILTLSILDGPQIGQTLPVPDGRSSVGGRGSGADIELSGLPDGIKCVELAAAGNRWGLIEFDPGTVRLNGRRLKLKNALSNGDTILLPSKTSREGFRFTVNLERQKSGGGGLSDAMSRVNPVVLMAVAVYLVLMVGAAAFFMLAPEAPDQARAVTVAEVTSALEADITALSETPPAGGARVILSNEPASYADLASLMQSGLEAEEKTRLREAFKSRIQGMFSEAWRLEQQRRYDEAGEIYQTIMTLMGARDLQTTELALRKLELVRRLN